MTNHEQLMDSIKSNSPTVYRILQKQWSQKWEITVGTTFKTTDQAPLSKHEDVLAGPTPKPSQKA